MDQLHLVQTVAFGIIVGISLGLTSVGSTLAVPFLVYGLGLRPHEAVCASMIAIGATSLVGTLQNLRQGRIHAKIAWILGAAGMLAAPFGAWIGQFLDGRTLMQVFSLLLLILGIRMLWPSFKPDSACAVDALRSGGSITLVLLVGLIAGFLAGFLGVGGGFLLVPALVLWGGHDAHRAVATSLFVVTLIGLSATSSHLLGGQTAPLRLTLFFGFGCAVGFAAGSRLERCLPVDRLQKIFAAGILIMGLLMLRA